MKKKYKGQPGYFKYKKLQNGLISLAGLLIILAVYVAGYIYYGTPRNYITILAVCLFLPIAKFLVQYLMFPWKGYITQSEYDKIAGLCGELDLYSELMITASEKRFQISYLLIDKEDNIIAYTPDNKADITSFEKGVTNFLNYYEFNSKVKLYTELKSFEKKCTNLATRNKELTIEEKEHIQLVLEKISIMSL